MLAAVPEGAGTLLGHTLVVWTAEFSKSNTHDWRNMPFLLAGGAGGSLRTGRCVTARGLPTNRLHTTIARLMGAAAETVGDPAYGGGTLPDLGV
jgi:hypothetical protein